MIGSFARWRRNFLTGLAVVFPAVVSIAVLVWLFGTVSNITDTLLFFLPRSLTHHNEGAGPIYWYWSLCALLVGVGLVTAFGALARNYLGRTLIQWLDQVMCSVPLLNKIYGTVKQVNEAFSTGKKSAFKQVVTVQFPHPGVYSVGFVTSDEPPAVAATAGQKMVVVFVPTTPNPTGGFLLIVPEQEVTKLNMSVADGIKYIISLGALLPEQASRPGLPPPRP